MKSDDLQAIGKTLLRIVKPEMTPKWLMKAVKKVHPKAAKQDIVRAALLHDHIERGRRPLEIERVTSVRNRRAGVR